MTHDTLLGMLAGSLGPDSGGEAWGDDWAEGAAVGVIRDQVAGPLHGAWEEIRPSRDLGAFAARIPVGVISGLHREAEVGMVRGLRDHMLPIYRETVAALLVMAYEHRARGDTLEQALREVSGPAAEEGSVLESSRLSRRRMLGSDNHWNRESG